VKEKYRRIRRSLSFGSALVLAIAVPALAGQSEPPPADVVTIDAGSDQLTLWPFTTENYQPGEAGQSDPINLVFLNTDPRAIRQELMRLGPDRPAWSFLPSGAKGCVWMDAMGYEQAAYLEPEGWVGGEVQLACATPDSPLGREYRFHVRLFRSGAHTIGGAHFEINVPGTAEHETLSWELARQFVTDEIARLDGGAFQDNTPVFQPTNGSFRTARGLINAYVWQTNAGNPAFLLALGLPPPQPPFPPVPIPASGLAAVFAPAFTYEPVSSDVTLTDSRSYFVQSTPKPFCDGTPIQITGGPLTFTLRTQTNPSGKYQRTYMLGGSLVVKTLSTGVVQDALISEIHRGMLTDNHEQVTEEVSQILLATEAAAGQSLNQAFGAGNNDYFIHQEECAIE
jgi:hypothetical protein